MGLVARARSFWRSVVHRSSLEQALADELQFHIAARADDLVARRGLSPGEALRAARLEFGSVERYKEESRQSLGLRLIDEARADMRYAARTFARSKAFTAAAVATLALGIGATTAIFSVIDAVILRLLPVQRPEELVRLLVQRTGRPAGYSFTNPLWEAIRDQQDVFSTAFAWSAPTEFLLTDGPATRSIQGIVVSGDFFQGLGIAPELGRLVANVDDHRGCRPLAVLGHRFWRTQFAASPSAIGNAVILNGRPVEVIGVTGPEFHGINVGRTFDVALPLCASALFDPQNVESRGRWWLSVMGRPRPGVLPDHITASLGVLSPRIMATALPPASPAAQQEFLTRTLVSEPGGGGASDLRRDFRDPLNVLMVIVAIVLLVGAANIASLMLARATTRGREFATRYALGGSRSRLVRQLLTESALLSCAGAALGLLFARWGAPLLVRSLSTANNPIYVDLAFDRRVLAFVTTVTIATVLIVGLMPALRSTRTALIESMKTRSADLDWPRFRLGKLIIAGQVALSLVLLIGGGLLLRTFVKLVSLDLGFDRNNVLVVSARPPRVGAEGTTLPPAARTAAYNDIAARLRSIPGVVSVARAFTTPVGDDNWYSSIHADLPNAPEGDAAACYFNFVAPGYFATLRTPLLGGRDFSEHDAATAPAVAIVNEALARKFFSGSNALGRHFTRSGVPGDVEIVGIVADSKYESVRQTSPATAFFAAAQLPPDRTADEFVLRTAVTPTAVIHAVGQTVAEVHQDISVTVRTLAEQIDDDLVQERLVATLAGFFGALALLLSMIGLYGVLSYLVSKRQIEFGVRIALGAQPASVMRLVLSEMAVVLAGGLVTGLAIAFVTVTLLKGMLFGLEPRDAATMITAVALLAAMALLAAYLPARRATRVDPMIALRSE
jgi:putative ABC transport system permease protein